MKTKDVAIGSIYAMASRLVLLVSGFAIQIVLARRLGPELFGIYTLIISIVLWTEHTVTTGIPSVFQKIVSERKDRIRSLFGAIGRYSIPYCVGIAFLFLLASPEIAELLGERTLLSLLLIASFDIPVFGLFTTFTCMLSGHGNFLAGSVIAAAYSTLRAVVIVMAVLLGFGVAGALLGNAIGSTLGLAIAGYVTYRTGLQYASDSPLRSPAALDEVRQRILGFGLPYALCQILNSLLIHVDIWFVKALSAQANISDESLGHYAVAYNLARIPYFIISGITFTVFPAVSRAIHENRVSDARKIIRQLLRLIILILLPLNVLVYTNSENIVELLFSDTYIDAGKPLRVLFAGVSIYVVLLFQLIVIAAGNRPKTSLAIAVALLPVSITLQAAMVVKHGIMGAAISTATVSLVGVLLASSIIAKRYGNFVDFRSIARVATCSLATYFASQFEALYSIHLVAGFTLLGLLYLFLLVLFGEVDRKLINEVFGQ